MAVSLRLGVFPTHDAEPMQSETPRHPLHDHSAEQLLLGMLLRNPAGAIAVAREHLKPQDLHVEIHALALELIYSFDEEGKAINPTTLNSWIKHNPAVKELDKLTGEGLPPGREAAFYLGMLAQGASVESTDVSSVAIVLAELARRRQAVEVLVEAEHGIQGYGRAHPEPLIPMLTTVVNLADELSEGERARTVSTEVGDVGDELIRNISNQAETSQQFGMRTFCGELDDVLGGLYPENLVIVGGRPGMGKSALGEKLVKAAALQDIPADWWSIEMPGRECAARMQADEDYDQAIDRGLKGLKYENLVKMRATLDEFERATLAQGRLRQLPISIFAEDRVTISRIAAVTRARVAKRPGPRLVLIDHMHILMPEDRYKGRRVDELSEITSAAKRLAKRTGSIVVMLAQLSRDIEKRDDKHPLMSDFRDSGSIEQDADVILGLYRGEYYANAAIRGARSDEQKTKAIATEEACHRKLEIEVLKQRSGATRTTTCFIDIASSAIRPVAPIPRTVAELALVSN